jgi:hypothetical protein
MVSRPARFRRTHALEAEAGKDKLVDEYVDNTNQVILGHVVVQMLGQQRTLSATLALDKALHLVPMAAFYQLLSRRYAPVVFADILPDQNQRVSWSVES